MTEDWEGPSRLRIVPVIVQRIMSHRAVALDRAERRADTLQPFARGPDGVAARLTLAFEHPRRLLLRRGHLAICIEPGMGGAGLGEDRSDGGTVAWSKRSGDRARPARARPNLRDQAMA